MYLNCVVLEFSVCAGMILSLKALLFAYSSTSHLLKRRENSLLCWTHNWLPKWWHVWEMLYYIRHNQGHSYHSSFISSNFSREICRDPVTMIPSYCRKGKKALHKIWNWLCTVWVSHWILVPVLSPKGTFRLVYNDFINHSWKEEAVTHPWILASRLLGQ